MAIFKRRHLRKVLSGDKTQTRRSHKHTWTIGKTYCIRDRWFSKPQGHITVTRKFRQRLSDISQEDIQKEGFSSLEEFKQEWTALHGSWNPEQIVTAYEFKLTDSKQLQRGSLPRTLRRSPRKGRLLIDSIVLNESVLEPIHSFSLFVAIHRIRNQLFAAKAPLCV